jgi:hypothetical protein
MRNRRVLAERRQDSQLLHSRRSSGGPCVVGTPQPIPVKTDRPNEPLDNPAQPAQLHGSSDPENGTAHSDPRRRERGMTWMLPHSNRPTGRRSSPCTTSCSRSPRRGSSPSTEPSRSERFGAPRPRSLWSTNWTWTTTNPSTPPEPICSGGSAEPARPRPPTSAQPRWRQPTPSGTSSDSVAERRAPIRDRSRDWRACRPASPR